MLVLLEIAEGTDQDDFIAEHVAVLQFLFPGLVIEDFVELVARICAGWSVEINVEKLLRFRDPNVGLELPDGQRSKR